MSAPSTSGLSVELLLRVIDVKYGYFTFTLLSLYFSIWSTSHPNWTLGKTFGRVRTCKGMVGAWGGS